MRWPFWEAWLEKLITPAEGAYAYPLLVKQLLRNALVQVRDQEIVYRSRRFTYGEFGNRVSRLASALRDHLGVQPGDTVGIMDWDSNRFLEALFAVPMMGAVLQTINVRLSPEQVAYTINHARPSVILVNAEFAGLLAEIRPHLTTAKRFVLMQDAPLHNADTPVAGFDAGYEEMLATGHGHYEFPDFDENTQATAFYTTGTTGEPKGVYFSHRQIVLHTLSLLANLALAPSQGRFHRDSVYMPMTPLFHVHGWGLPWCATAAGVKQVYPGRYEPAALLNLIRTEGVTFTHCVPTILQMLLNAPESQATDLSKLTMAVGGSALPVGLARQAMARGIDVFGGFGMSETGPVLTISHLTRAELTGDADTEAPLRTGTGAAGPLVEIRVVDGAMNDVPHDGATVGEMVVRAPWLTQGYLHNPEASETLWAGGYLHTGDLATMTASGRIRLRDRIKDVVKTGGEWVSSVLLEDLISQAPHVSQVAIIGVEDAKWGERPLAVVVPDAGAAVLPADLQRHLRRFVDEGVISKYAVPEQFVFAASLPKTSVGKVDKKQLRLAYGVAAPT